MMLLVSVIALGQIVAQETGVLQQDLALKYLAQLPKNGAQHSPVIILLHGYGSDEKDMFGLRSALPARYLIVAARAPYPLPYGGYEWYESATVNGHPDGDTAQLARSRKLIRQFINQIVIKYKANAKNVYVAGFSQGAIMSYQVGLTAPGAIKGIAPLSGKIFESLKPLVKPNSALKQLRIFVAHGTADDRIPYKEGKAAVDYLRSIGLKPEFHAYAGMGHDINNNVLTDFLKWLQ